MNTIAAGLELAEGSGAALHIISFVDVDPSTERDSLYEAFNASNRSVVDAVIARTAQSSAQTVTVSIAAGAPAQVIRQYATEHEIDCIVMGTQDQTNLEYILDERVMEAVLRQVEVPVYTVPLHSQSGIQRQRKVQ
ncbi:universal stress protein [Haladaptatus halobius]|uniref:universal stress protein n=1 Tax=Haladaptatus halobius TaxID=2884875 RepID=UPI0021048BFC|nr:universal stress protein [Haladaptatus halobius]